MRRVGIFLSALVAAIAMGAPDVSAQPKVTITGFIDHVSSWNKNLSNTDLNPSVTSDDEWYARTRARPDVVAEVGTTKFVLGLELDAAWGQTGAADNANPLRFGTSAGWDLGTDTTSMIEVKWAYTEVDLPLIPFRTRMRLGAQPWTALYKPGLFATGDFPGVHLTSQWTPIIKANLTYAQIEEEATGPKDGFILGEDYVFIGSVEVSPFKGLDIRPIFSFASFDSVTSASSRPGRGGVGTTAATFPLGANEHRYTVGVDTRWKVGPVYLDPTFFYQFGHRDQVRGGVLDTLKRDAWLFDLRVGWQAGPLLLEAIGVYTTGNKAEDRIDVHPDVVGSSAATLGRRSDTLEFFEPIITDNGFFGLWSEITAGGVDYFNRIRARAGGSLNTGVGIGYDKYGIMRIGGRAHYALTPAFTVRLMASGNWTAEEVDTSANVDRFVGVTPGDADGDERFYGAEVNLGILWRFAPNVAFEMSGNYFFTGDAFKAAQITPFFGAARAGNDPEDIKTVAMRVRYSF